MTAEVARPAAPDLDLRPAAPRGGGRFAAMFDAYAAHLFDYCYSLLGNEQDAADATAASLVIAYSLIDRLKDPGRLRAWLFALARRECLDANPVRATLPRLTGDPALDEVDAPPAAPRLATLAEPQREVLDLVYRHGVSAAELPAVLGISAADAKALLATAAELSAAGRASADQGNADLSGNDTLEVPAADPESWIAVLAAVAGATGPEAPGRADGARPIQLMSLLPLPPSIRRRAAHVALDPDLASYRESLGASLGEFGIDGFPLPPPPPPPPRRKLVLASGGLAAALLAPAAAGAVLFSIFGGPHAVSHVLKDILDPGSSSQGTQVVIPHQPSSALFPKKHEHSQVLPVFLQPSPRASSHKPRPKPSQTSRIPPTSSASPSVSPTSPSPSPTSPSPSPTSPTSTP